jgi:hypothetical protein
LSRAWGLPKVSFSNSAGWPELSGLVTGVQSLGSNHQSIALSRTAPSILVPGAGATAKPQKPHEHLALSADQDVVSYAIKREEGSAQLAARTEGETCTSLPSPMLRHDQLVCATADRFRDKNSGNRSTTLLRCFRGIPVDETSIRRLNNVKKDQSDN